jgi:hypothetical protein
LIKFVAYDKNRNQKRTPQQTQQITQHTIEANLIEKDCNFDTKLQSFSMSNLKF